MRNEAVYDAIARLRESGRAGLLATVVAIRGSSPGALGSKMLLTEDGQAVGTVGGGCIDGQVWAEMPDVLATERPRQITVDLTEQDDPEHGLICGGRVDVFLEPILTTHLVICGSGHIALALARLAAPLDFRVTVLDDRPQFLNAERFPGARLILGEFDDTLARWRAPRGAFVAVVTRGHRHDQACLEWALRQDAPRYVGLVGSRAKIRKLLLRARERGLPEEQLEAVRAPIGLDIGSVTVEEIALSVAAELVAVRRRGPGASRDLRDPGRVDPRQAALPPATKLPPRREAPAVEALAVEAPAAEAPMSAPATQRAFPAT
ncbi:MAG: XdhC family protein [Planctomycetes bacterium]|nr:XdhC family protein [Planctomycetota bacterium]